MKRLTALAASLMLAVLTNVIALPTAPASAAVQPCTVTYSGEGLSLTDKNRLASSTITLADSRHVTDVDLTVDLLTPNFADLKVYFYRDFMGARAAHAVATGQASGAANGLYSFDDEATSGQLTGNAPGRYLPYDSLTALEGSSGAGDWHLWVERPEGRTTTATLRSWSITVTFATCDSDGDGIQDHLDNCAFDINADQANLDGDALGDACDPDIDNDGVPNGTDPCPTVAGLPTTGCPAPPTEPEVTEVSRKATLVKKARKRRLVVTVRSEVGACQRRTPGVLKRVGKGKKKDVRVAKFKTNRKGKKTLRLPKRKGRYYVQLPARKVDETTTCAAVRSNRIRR